jgi:hypothetical protein
LPAPITAIEVLACVMEVAPGHGFEKIRVEKIGVEKDK